MGNGAQQQAGDKGLLVDRLQKHIDRLQDVYSLQQNVQLQEAIQALKEELEDLRIVASHVYGAPPHR